MFQLLSNWRTWTHVLLTVSYIRVTFCFLPIKCLFFSVCVCVYRCVLSWFKNVPFWHLPINACLLLFFFLIHWSYVYVMCAVDTIESRQQLQLDDQDFWVWYRFHIQLHKSIDCRMTRDRLTPLLLRFIKVFVIISAVVLICFMIR